MILLFLGFALAEPARCIAVWSAPTPACAVTEPLRVEGTGRTEEKARSAAQDALADALTYYATARQLRYPALNADAITGCAAAAEQVTVTCFPEADLRRYGTCFASFEAPSCWNGNVWMFESTGWKALDMARHQVCREVEAYNPDPIHQAECRAQCEAEIKVGCPVNPG